MKLTDKEIIEGFRSKDIRHSRETCNTFFESYFHGIKKYILQNNGTSEDAKDIFQEASFFLIRDIRANKEFRKDVSSYFFGICKNLWLKNLRDKKKGGRVKQDWQPQTVLLENEDQEKIDLLLRITDRSFALLKEDCQKILTYFYKEKMRMAQIAKKMKLTNIQAAKDKKHRCIKNLRKIFFENFENE